LTWCACGLVAVGSLVGCSSAKTAVTPLDPVDVSAAQACQSFAKYVTDLAANDSASVLKADSADVATKAGVLLDGAAATQAAGTAQPKWAGLGADIITATGDLASESSALTSDANKVLDGCNSIPADAKTAAGYKGQAAG
jgi:hypothetical protein